MSVSIYLDGSQRNNVEQIKIAADSSSTQHKTFYSLDNASELTGEELLAGKIAYGKEGKVVGLIPTMSEANCTLEGVYLDYDQSQRILYGTISPEGDYGAYINGATKITCPIENWISVLSEEEGNGNIISGRYKGNIMIDASVGHSFDLKGGTWNQDLSASKYNYSSYKSKVVDCGNGIMVVIFPQNWINSESNATSNCAIHVSILKVNEDGSIIKSTAPIPIDTEAYSARFIEAFPLKTMKENSTEYIYLAYPKSTSVYHCILKIVNSATDPTGYTCEVVSAPTAIAGVTLTSSEYRTIGANIIQGPMSISEPATDAWRIVLAYIGTYQGNSSYSYRPMWVQINVDYETKELTTFGVDCGNTTHTLYTTGSYTGSEPKIVRMSDEFFVMVYTTDSADYDYADQTVCDFYHYESDGACKKVATFDYNTNNISSLRYASNQEVIALSETKICLFASNSSSMYYYIIELKYDSSSNTYSTEMKNTSHSNLSLYGGYSTPVKAFKINSNSIYLFGYTSSNIGGAILTLDEEKNNIISKSQLYYGSNIYVDKAIYWNYGDIAFDSFNGGFVVISLSSNSISSTMYYYYSYIPGYFSKNCDYGKTGTVKNVTDNLITVRESNSYLRFNYK